MFNDLDARFAAFATTFEALDWVGVVFLIAIISESIWDIVVKRQRRLGETLANTAIALGNALLDRTVFGLVFVLGVVASESLAIASIPVTWWSWVLALLAADFTYYWMHRCEHKVRLLWAYHSVHHSSPEFNLTTSLRLAWVEGLFEWVFFLPMILIGFDAVQTIAALVIVVVYQTWIHCEKIGKLGWLDRVFNTPSVHRVHHASNTGYIDRNFGGILIIWDRLFGTYQPEEQEIVYGITKPVGSMNPLVINFHEYWQIAKDVWNAGSFRAAMGYVLREPGWSPGTDKGPTLR